MSKESGIEHERNTEQIFGHFLRSSPLSFLLPRRVLVLILDKRSSEIENEKVIATPKFHMKIPGVSEHV